MLIFVPIRPETRICLAGRNRDTVPERGPRPPTGLSPTPPPPSSLQVEDAFDQDGEELDAGTGQ